MAATQESFVALKQEMDALKLQFQGWEAFPTWKAEVERKILAHDEKQAKTEAELRELYAESSPAISGINNKLLHSPPGTSGERKKEWQMTRPKDMAPAMFSGKEE